MARLVARHREPEATQLVVLFEDRDERRVELHRLALELERGVEHLANRRPTASRAHAGGHNKTAARWKAMGSRRTTVHWPRVRPVHRRPHRATCRSASRRRTRSSGAEAAG